MELYNDISMVPVAAPAFWAIIGLLAAWSVLEGVAILRRYRDQRRRSRAVWLDAQQWLINVLRLCMLGLMIGSLRYVDHASWILVLAGVAFYTIVSVLVLHWEARVKYSRMKVVPEPGSQQS